MNQLNSKFGEFGGMYVPELLIPALDQICYTIMLAVLRR